MITKEELTKRKVKLGTKLYKARIEAHLTQSELSARGIVRQSQLSKYENGELLPNVFQLRELADCYNKDLYYFLD